MIKVKEEKILYRLSTKGRILCALLFDCNMQATKYKNKKAKEITNELYKEIQRLIVEAWKIGTTKEKFQKYIDKHNNARVDEVLSILMEKGYFKKEIR